MPRNAVAEFPLSTLLTVITFAVNTLDVIKFDDVKFDVVTFTLAVSVLKVPNPVTDIAAAFTFVFACNTLV